jgi:hypothetical protein
VHFVHGSTIGLNDFWWESLAEAEHRRRVAASGADLIMCTHSGLPWIRQVDGSLVVNVGVLGRPPNDGRTAVRYAIADLAGGTAGARIIDLAYDWHAHAAALRRAGLPEEFAYTCETGWWTTCLEILPAAERSQGAFHVYDSSVPALLQAFDLPAWAWQDPDPAVPARPLWGSPLLPNRIWYDRSTPGMPELARTAAVSGTELRDAATFCRGHGSNRPAFLPELTITPRGWFWDPTQVQPALLPADTGTAPTTQFAAARQAATHRLLELLQDQGLLLLPRHCAA